MTKTRKTYVLDTNILIHNPDAVTSFDGNNVRVPIEVIQELDRMKTEQTDRGRAARAAVRSLLKFLGVAGGEQTPVLLANGGSLSVLVPPADHDSPSEARIRKLVRDVGGDFTSADNRIIAAAIRESRLPDNNCPVILVTKDGSMSLKASAAGLVVEDYRSDKVTPDEARITETPVIACGDHEIHQFNVDHRLMIMDGREDGLLINEYVVLQGDTVSVVPARYVGRGVVQRLFGFNGFNVPGGSYMKAINLEQHFLVDALLDPAIDLVTICGQAGTGKTILSMGAGLHLVGTGKYNLMSITRPVMAMGNDIGFLPGSLEEKMGPWLQGYSDAATAIFTKRPLLDKPQSDRKERTANSRKANGTTPRVAQAGLDREPIRKPFDNLIARGLLEIQAMTFIRGRSIPDSILVLDEAQNTNAHQIKTVVTRMARNSKLIVSGDPAQIDSPWVDGRSNGLVYLRSRMNNLANVAHVVLRKGERSPLADMAAKLL